MIRPSCIRSEVRASLHRLGSSDGLAVRLLCFPHAGGGPWSFNSLRRLLPERIELVAVQVAAMPSGGCDGIGGVTVQTVVSQLYAEVRALLDRPLAIYGHSLGAVLAFEMARELRRRGDGLPLSLFVSGRRAPHRPPRRTVQGLNDDELLSVLEEMGGASPMLLANTRWRERYLPKIRADLALSDAYTYTVEAPLECPLYAYLGDTDRVINEGDWEEWAQHGGAGFRRGRLSGTHFFSHEGEKALASEIRHALDAEIRKWESSALGSSREHPRDMGAARVAMRSET